MICLAVCNHKGGTGKTTSAIHTAAALGLSGRRTLVIDLDPQGFMTRMLGVEEPAPGESSLALFDPEGRLSDVPVVSLPSFDLLPASMLLTKVMRKLNKPTDVLWAKEALEAPLEYDVVLFDTAAAVTVYSLNALVAARHVLIPVAPEYQPVLGAEQTYATVDMVRKRLNPALEMPYFLFTMVDARKRNHHHYRKYLRKHYGDRVMDSLIRTSAALSISHNDGTTTFDNDPYSRGVRDYANAADELVRLIESPARPAPAPQADAEPPRAEALPAPPSLDGSVPV